MREIKFRVWDGENLHHINEEEELQITFGMKGQGWSVWHPYDEVINSNDAEAVLMQYTGLKDKNGKDIYEGDVVKGYWWYKGESHRHIGKVTYGMSAFKVVGVKKYFGISDELNPVYEVIGNIHENPELLNTSK